MFQFIHNKIIFRIRTHFVEGLIICFQSPKMLCEVEILKVHHLPWRAMLGMLNSWFWALPLAVCVHLALPETVDQFLRKKVYSVTNDLYNFSSFFLSFLLFQVLSFFPPVVLFSNRVLTTSYMFIMYCEYIHTCYSLIKLINLFINSPTPTNPVLFLK